MSRSHPRTAFVLAGGGSLGAVQVGMLAALVEAGVAADLVVGSSVGAINAAYFAGRPDARGVRALVRIWTGLRRRQVFPVRPLGSALGVLGRSDHLVDPRSLARLIERHLPYERLEQARIPVHAVATELANGEEVVLSEGPAVTALLASTAIPAVFPPVRVAGHVLVDGGVASNTPISLAADLGAERIVVLPTGCPCSIGQRLRGVLPIALHALNLLIAHQMVHELRACAGRAHIVTAPPLCPLAVSAYDFSQSAALIERAAQGTRRWLAERGLERPADPDLLVPHTHAA